ncbi:MAG: YicC/YloC family endoribonuclease [Lachnospiraceae bacterium]|jgi:uncharacterized protein (TIGR00255 family)
MVRSMTGFGRCEYTEGGQKAVVEIKSVNHRFLEMSVRMPKKLGSLETNVREEVKKYACRGKIDVSITYENNDAAAVQLQYNKNVAQSYMEILSQMKQDFGLTDSVTLKDLASFPDVITEQEAEQDTDELWAFLKKAVDGAGEQFAKVREAEGENLKADLIDKIEGLESLLQKVEQKSPEIVEDYSKKLRERVMKMADEVPVDETRLAQEVVLYADKICVDEEIVRLHSHFSQAASTLEAGGSVGRKLDFIVQEMNREANTILSKIDDVSLSQIAIEMKTGIEKIREQIQNLE